MAQPAATELPFYMQGNFAPVDREVTDTNLAVEGHVVRAGRVHWFDVDPEHEVFEYRDETVHPQEAALPESGRWTFPAASVSAVEVEIQGQAPA